MKIARGVLRLFVTVWITAHVLAGCGGDTTPPPVADTGAGTDGGPGMIDAARTDGGASDAGGSDASPDGSSPVDAASDATDCASAPDVDGDGHRAIACGGDDCDDHDPNAFPGNTEVCDTRSHDEDCDPSTFGVRDADGDGYPDARCCDVDPSGGTHCGSDCDDTRASANPSSVEACNHLDDDCDGATDEGVTVTFWPDDDGDGRGQHDATRTMMGCAGMAPAGYAESDDDCDDTRAYVHPGLPESCDPGPDGIEHDENCDGSVDEGCDCIGSVTEACPGAMGACAAGVQTCVSGRYSACSIMPQAETCNGIDDDCNGIIDDSLRVTCYVDVDGDTYAPMGATSASDCQVTSRAAVGGCPDGTTNRMPSVGVTDCDDLRYLSSPMGAEVCNGIDDDCDGSVDESVSVTCYADNDEDTFAVLGAPATARCPDPTRSLRGFCPFQWTPTMPTTSGLDADCNDAVSNGASDFPGALELCDGRDNDCDGSIDEMTMVVCYTDSDNDTWAPTGATTSMQCRAINRAMWGGCPLGTTSQAPGTVPDCNDTVATTYPNALELCDGVDNDCNGLIDDGARVTCYADPDNDTYAVSGATTSMQCRDPSRTAVDGCMTATTNRAPSGAASIDCHENDAASFPGAVEVCDGLDNDCDGSTDEGLARVSCYLDTDDDGLAALSQMGMGMLTCPDASRASRGNCPVGLTGSAPTSTSYDCNDGDALRHWPSVACWRDDDGDGYACPTTDTSLYDCRAGGTGSMTSMRIDLCTTVAGTCDPGYTGMDPGAGPGSSFTASDCNDSSTGNASHTWVPCYQDGDNDGYATSTIAHYVCSGASCPAGSRPTSLGDCNDANATVHSTITCYRDADIDSYGAGPSSQLCTTACSNVSGYSATNNDCCDSDGNAHPNQSGYFVPARTCGGWDYNCDGVQTELFTTTATLNCSYVSGEGCIQSGVPGWVSTIPGCGGPAASYATDCIESSPGHCTRVTVSDSQECH